MEERVVTHGAARALLWLAENLGRRQKQLVLVGCDALLFSATMAIAFAARLGPSGFAPEHWRAYFWVLPTVLAVRLPAFACLGLYRTMLRRRSRDLNLLALLGVSIGLIGNAVPLAFFHVEGLPRSVLLVEGLLAVIFTVGSRDLVSALLRKQIALRNAVSVPVVIYGAGNSGTQLAELLAGGQEYRPVCFVDDDTTKRNLRIGGLEVYGPEKLPWIAKTLGVADALVACPSLPGWKRQAMIARAQEAGMRVHSVPNYLDLLSGRVGLDDFAEVKADDLLGREAVAPVPALISANVTGKCVLVTGAGGSIGSELCRQIAARKPEVLVLFERSEFALYTIEVELRERFPELLLFPVLGDVVDRDRLVAACRRYAVRTVYHAAAYKHVPMVELNPLEGLRNNVFGTLSAAEAALEAGVDTFVLVSTDKAVRPTNVMGASKRIAELVVGMVQQRALRLQEESGRAGTRFVLVRFGNVLDSAGSVVPLFRRQIAAGGPVTVTHPDVTRFFMTIPEAAQLVLQAGALADPGEVCLLDMGEPVKVLDLADRMIRLATARSGREIEIRYTGLRPGEKLHEELLIDRCKARPSDHPKIFVARETCPAASLVSHRLEWLRAAIEERQVERALALAEELVEGYESPAQHHELVHTGAPVLARSWRRPRDQDAKSSATTV